MSIPPFLESLKEAPSHLKFFKELLSKKDPPKEPSVTPITEVCNAVLKHQALSKLPNPSNFSIPCSIRDVKIESALYDLGASVSLMPFSLSRNCLI